MSLKRHDLNNLKLMVLSPSFHLWNTYFACRAKMSIRLFASLFTGRGRICPGNLLDCCLVKTYGGCSIFLAPK